jgi:hypothetical protein
MGHIVLLRFAQMGQPPGEEFYSPGLSRLWCSAQKLPFLARGGYCMPDKEIPPVPHAKVLQAESFQLVNEQGEIIAVLAASPDKRPNLLVFD